MVASYFAGPYKDSTPVLLAGGGCSMVCFGISPFDSEADFTVADGPAGCGMAYSFSALKPDAIARQTKGGAPTGSRSTIVQDRRPPERSEEHTSELQSLTNIVCRLLLAKKKT